MNKLKAFPNMVIVIGVVFALTGLITIGGGIYINMFVGDQLANQNIVTPSDASIPDAPVNSIATALSMADIIQHHANARTNDLSYAEMGRFALPDGDPAGTSNRDEALLDDAGNPVSNSARDTQLTASGLITSLSLSAMALGASYGVIAFGVVFTILGIVVAGLGYALLGLIEPQVAERFGLKTVAAGS